MVYVPPSNQDLLTSAQVEVHVKRGGIQAPYPKADDADVLELYAKKKIERDDNTSKAKDSGELSEGLHVPPASENPEHIIVAGSKEINKNLSTPGAAPLLSDNVGVVTETDPNADTIDPITGEIVTKEERDELDPFSGTELAGRKDLADDFSKIDTTETEYERRERERNRSSVMLNGEETDRERELRLLRVVPENETPEDRERREQRIRDIEALPPEDGSIGGSDFMSKNPSTSNAPVIESEEEKKIREDKEQTERVKEAIRNI